MNYINLHLRKHDKQDNQNLYLRDVIRDNTLIVLLGAPGSGKTSIFKKYKEKDSSTTEFLTVKKFIHLEPNISKTTKILLLDGLDEYRSVEHDKTFVITTLADKIKKLNKDIKVVISCREMDWYGEVDRASLKNEIGEDAKLYNVMPLDEEQKEKLASLLKIENKESFIDRFSSYGGFLDNPQMFIMLAEIYKNNTHSSIISSKKDLYSQFIKNSVEHNLEYTHNNIALSQLEIFKYAGYIAFYYIFCNIDILNDDNFIDSIANEEKGYPKEKIKQALNTKLFSDGKFIHRTIAEFLLAKFIVKNKFTGDIAQERIKGLFSKKKRVPTELRGSFSWLCSLSEEREFIKIDPYYQVIHGDNSLFNNSLKKEIVLQIKKHAELNPYFFDSRQRKDLEGFYHRDLDNFLMEEFTNSLQLQNHYKIFIASIIITAQSVSKKMLGFSKKIILDDKVPSYVKARIIKIFQDRESEIDFLKEALEKIKNNKITDQENYIKEKILDILYPKFITPNDIEPYLKLYHIKKDKHYYYYYCDFLYKTEYQDKYDLVCKIYKLNATGNKETFSLPKHINHFVYDYFAETILKFEDGLKAEEIYNIIKYFKTYYGKYRFPKFESYRHPSYGMLKNDKEKLTKLANELFSLYLDDHLRESEDPFYLFERFTPLPYSPDNKSKILLDKMDPNLNKKQNLSLLNASLFCRNNAGEMMAIYMNLANEKAKQFNFEKELKKWLNPEKNDWKIKQEKEAQKEKEKSEKIKQENELYFSKKTDDDIQKNFGVLHHISKQIYYKQEYNENHEKNLIKDTFNRLKNILKKAIFNRVIEPNLLTLKSLAKNSPGADRNIDLMYYVSCTLNNSQKIASIKEGNFTKYLYIITWINSEIGRHC